MYNTLTTPIGKIYILFNSNGIYKVLLEEGFKKINNKLEYKDLNIYKPNLESLTEFSKKVLLKTYEIPLGEVRTYKWLANEIGSPASSRAVGNVLANNPIPFIIPCHRIIHSSGNIGRYIWGSEIKVKLLEAEGINVINIKRYIA